MTKEIALHCMKSASDLTRELCEECPIYGQTGSDHCFEDALQYVIGMLEQGPYVDVVSRAEVNQVIEDYMDEQYHVLSDKTRERAFGARAVMARINELSSVTPQPKTGHWVEHHNEAGPCWEFSRYECSKCHGWATDNSDYCPNCGAKMVESQDRSDKE